MLTETLQNSTHRHSSPGISLVTVAARRDAKREAPRIDAAPYRDQPDALCHVGVHDLVDTGRRVCLIDAQRTGAPGDGAFGEAEGRAVAPYRRHREFAHKPPQQVAPRGPRWRGRR